jgi:ketosteroid isomerase-like protein
MRSVARSSGKFAPHFTVKIKELFTNKRRTLMKTSRSKSLLQLTACLSLLGVATLHGWTTSASRPVATQTLTPAQIEAAVEEYFASVTARDVQRYANNFVTEGVLEDPVGTPPIQGQSAIAAFFAAGIASIKEIKPSVQEIIVGGNEAIVNWKIKVKTATGKQITVDGMGLFKFNAEGKLLAVREFWDLAAFLAQSQN